MGRKLPEEFEGQELAPLCLASNQHEAEEIEKALDEGGMDYTFDIAPFSQESVFSILFGSTKEGVMFLVTSENFQSCVTLLNEAGLSYLIIE